MGRPIVLSNGRMLIGLNEHGLVHDFYYPYVGQENMTSTRQVHHKIGIWVDGEFSWLDNARWEIRHSYVKDTLIGQTIYTSSALQIEVRILSFVDADQDIFARRVYVSDNRGTERNVRVFFHQVFQISRSGRGDTSMYVPSKTPYIMNFKGDTTFVSGSRTEHGACFDQYAIGSYMLEGKDGTFVDAEDGELSNNPIEHGGVDSVIRSSIIVPSRGTTYVDYWVSASMVDYHKAAHTHRMVAASGLSSHLQHTESYWRDWLKRSDATLSEIDPEFRDYFVHSLLITKAHIDRRGGVLASVDSSIYNYGRDYYSYVWPRDSVYVIMPLLRLGYTEEALEFLRFAVRGQHPRGYLHHKYQLDGTIGSTWHPMIQNGRPELNIQEDETAAVILLFYDLYHVIGMDDELHELFKELIIPATEFISEYIDHATFLPHASYDLWEEIFISSTYSTSVVMRAIECSIELARNFAPEMDTGHWQFSLNTLKTNFGKYYSSEKQYFVKGLRLMPGGEVKVDDRLDASNLLAFVRLRPLPLDNASVSGTITAIQEQLVNRGAIGGIMRYQDDMYMKSSQSSNSWFICSFWLAQYFCRVDRVDDAKDIVRWSMKYATETGALSEQLDPTNGQQKSVSPLTWSQAELLNTILDITNASEL